MTMEPGSEGTSIPDHKGEEYLEVLARIHTVLQPRTYVEVGTWTGNSLQLASCRAIAVDPHFQITSDVIGTKPECHFYQMGGDAFFRVHSPRQIFGEPVDLAFLDGMHLFEFVLRDFINIEVQCSRNSIIALHDCLPTDVYITSRTNDPAERARLSTRPGWWTGDVWKMLPILRTFRPDLTIVCLNAFPTGLVLITGLYPESRTLRDRYYEIVQQYRQVSLSEYGFAKFLSEAPLAETTRFRTIQDFGPTFWL
jgi:hypothetical protein